MNKKKKWIVGVLISLAIFTAAGAVVYMKSFDRPLDASKTVTAKRSGMMVMDGQEYSYNEDIINILCMGIDTKDPIDSKQTPGERGQSDAIYVISINQKEHSMFVVAIPRDTMVPVVEYDHSGNPIRQKVEQITLQHAYGSTEEESCELMAEAVSSLLGQIPIHRYIALDFNGVPVINDSVGGVDVTMDSEYVDQALATLNEEFYPGNTVHLEGMDSLYYLRTRDITVYASAAERVERQKKYIAAFTEKAKEKFQSNPFATWKLYKNLGDYMVTNLTKEDIGSLALSLDEYTLDLNVIDIPGERIRGEKHEEFYVNDDNVRRLVQELYYK